MTKCLGIEAFTKFLSNIHFGKLWGSTLKSTVAKNLNISIYSCKIKSKSNSRHLKEITSASEFPLLSDRSLSRRRKTSIYCKSKHIILNTKPPSIFYRRNGRKCNKICLVGDVCDTRKAARLDEPTPPSPTPPPKSISRLGIRGPGSLSKTPGSDTRRKSAQTSKSDILRSRI